MSHEQSSSNYTVLARRYRPQTFGDVVGQEHVSTAIQNAIQSNRVAHAYLFTGARGVGKTSMARILAKALNCPNSQDGIPCNECELCDAISAGQDVDVLEIDGASNRGIDDIRSLRANVNVKSMRTRYKVYIIDEVHMLTKEAFNALLKTLEEPPASVKFVFCTTEPNKVPDTILSRCQRFDFASIETQNIARRLKEIADSEGVNVAPDAIELVARRADGSMRDSQSLFDQLLAFGGETISADDVNQLLGTAGDDRLVACTEAVISQNRVELLDIIESAIGSGVQIGNFVDQLMYYFRDLMVLASGATQTRLISVNEQLRRTVQNQAERAGLSTTVAALQILSDTKFRLMRSSNPRPLLELALIRISLLENMEAVAALARAIKNGQQVNWQPTVAPVATPADSLPSQAVTREQETETTAQKKSDEPAEKPGSLEQSSFTNVDFEEKNLDEIWLQLIDISEDSVKLHLRAAKNCAIFGPNALEVTYSETYTFSKQYFDGRPEALASVEKSLREIVGKPVQIRFRIVADSVEDKNESKRENTNYSPDNDPFIQDACNTFGAAIVKFEPVGQSGRNNSTRTKEDD